ncbi:MAG: tRNA preQ1(34) S-adenosylmethionine ribosyltransferase-isomerase QueA [Phycisphaerales bacterium]|nr:MAG: tRNA preQ1(34) S-adenosylmethionine ribosyltransferase-isomerase QueA [Phycisphaerales bacterium]
MKEGTSVDKGNAGFTAADLDYELPNGLIAQHPLPKRDASRLLVVDRSSGRLHDNLISKLPDLLRPGDLLVLNDTRVLPAKFTAERRTGGKIGGLFVAEEEPGRWQVMLEGSRRLRVGESLIVTSGEQPGGVTLRLLEGCGAGFWRVEVDAQEAAGQILDRIGVTPLPPYIHRNGTDPAIDADDRSRYQTVYAQRPGAIAAPTAGLHLTEFLLDEVRAKGIETTFVTLHVGVGTFKPIDVERLSQHVMHAEWYELQSETAEAVRRCREHGGRVLAVGTTAVRVLESAAAEPTDTRAVRASCGMTDIFIYPPYQFRVVDALLTNFHLPRSTLLALVMALAGAETIRRAYGHAIGHGYRFYSYGDAMLIQ